MKLLRAISEKYDGVKDFINARVDKVCSHEKLSAEELFFLLVLNSLFSR